MKFKNLYELFVGELKDLYDAEHQIVKALPKLKKAASSDELQGAFDEHLQQTKTHIERLEEVFELIEEKAKRETCDAMKGLISEGDEIIEENDPSSALDAALIAAAQRVEHYEMAGYGTVRTYAQLLGHQDAANLLQETLDEEGETDKKLTRLAEEVNPEAV
ncbi:MAG: ferritin-like domain-containing protein [Anaerolineae bacterium]|nr:ferritin-like domain-containing protein [Anaerolineae bacterium]